MTYILKTEEGIEVCCKSVRICLFLTKPNPSQGNIFTLQGAR